VCDFWSDAEEADEPGRRRRGARAGPRAPRAGAPAKPRHHIVTHYNTVTQVTVGPCCADEAAQPPLCSAERLSPLGRLAAWAPSSQNGALHGALPCPEGWWSSQTARWAAHAPAGTSRPLGLICMPYYASKGRCRARRRGRGPARRAGADQAQGEGRGPGRAAAHQGPAAAAAGVGPHRGALRAAGRGARRAARPRAGRRERGRQRRPGRARGGDGGGARRGRRRALGRLGPPADTLPGAPAPQGRRGPSPATCSATPGLGHIESSSSCHARRAWRCRAGWLHPPAVPSRRVVCGWCPLKHALLGMVPWLHAEASRVAPSAPCVCGTPTRASARVFRRCW